MPDKNKNEKNVSITNINEFLTEEIDEEEIELMHTFFTIMDELEYGEE